MIDKLKKIATSILKKKISLKNPIKTSSQATIVIPKVKQSNYTSIHMQTQWENEKKSFLMK